MPDLLLELFSEEIPARMQARAAEDLRRLVTDRLVDAGLVYEGAGVRDAAPAGARGAGHAGAPARLKEEKKGPRVGAPDKAIEGFLKSAGLASIDEAKIQKDPKKGDFYVALIEKPGRAAIDVLAEILPVVIRTFPWPKSMRWGARSARPGALAGCGRCIRSSRPSGRRPRSRTSCRSRSTASRPADVTRGHRFLAPKSFRVKHFDDYAAKLDKAKVVLDPARAARSSSPTPRTSPSRKGFELVEDQGLLDEVAGLVEWPVVLMGSFDPAFLEMPPEVIRTTIRANQKCFVVRDRRRKLANKFILVANIEAADGGAAIIAGNERVIRARLSDAKFFYESDLKIPLEERLPKFKNIVFHEKLGTQWERIERIERLAVELAPLVGADVEKTERAARLAKADLLTEMVGEFPELQGLMGKYYAAAQGEDESVAAALRGSLQAGRAVRSRAGRSGVDRGGARRQARYACWFLGDRREADGSKDPYALRRAALGIIRIIVENKLRLNFSRMTEFAYYLLVTSRINAVQNTVIELLRQKIPNEREAILRVASSAGAKIAGG